MKVSPLGSEKPRFLRKNILTYANATKNSSDSIHSVVSSCGIRNTRLELISADVHFGDIFPCGFSSKMFQLREKLHTRVFVVKALEASVTDIFPSKSAIFPPRISAFGNLDIISQFIYSSLGHYHISKHLLVSFTYFSVLIDHGIRDRCLLLSRVRESLYIPIVTQSPFLTAILTRPQGNELWKMTTLFCTIARSRAPQGETKWWAYWEFTIVGSGAHVFFRQSPVSVSAFRRFALILRPRRRRTLWTFPLRYARGRRGNHTIVGSPWRPQRGTTVRCASTLCNFTHPFISDRGRVI